MGTAGLKYSAIHHQKERHHRRHEVGIGDLPRTAMVATAFDDAALDDYWTYRIF